MGKSFGRFHSGSEVDKGDTDDTGLLDKKLYSLINCLLFYFIINFRFTIFHLLK